MTAPKLEWTEEETPAPVKRTYRLDVVNLEGIARHVPATHVDLAKLGYVPAADLTAAKAERDEAKQGALDNRRELVGLRADYEEEREHTLRLEAARDAALARVAAVEPIVQAARDLCESWKARPSWGSSIGERLWDAVAALQSPTPPGDASTVSAPSGAAGPDGAQGEPATRGFVLLPRHETEPPAAREGSEASKPAEPGGEREVEECSAARVADSAEAHTRVADVIKQERKRIDEHGAGWPLVYADAFRYLLRRLDAALTEDPATPPAIPDRSPGFAEPSRGPATHALDVPGQVGGGGPICKSCSNTGRDFTGEPCACGLKPATPEAPAEPKPSEASPLPWRAHERYGHNVLAANGELVAKCTEPESAAFIVARANANPADRTGAEAREILRQFPVCEYEPCRKPATHLQMGEARCHHHCPLMAHKAPWFDALSLAEKLAGQGEP